MNRSSTHLETPTLTQNTFSRSASRLLTTALLVLGLSLTCAGANDSTHAAPPAEERVLLVVETSAAMQKRAENIQKIVGDVISSGLGGDLRDGDTVGFWTFNEELSTGVFPLQRWTKASRQRVAVSMVQFLQQQKFENTSKITAIWDALTNIVTNSERLTIILVTSGKENLNGTPFDGSIAQNFLKNADSQQKAKMPFVTILRAYRGKFVNFSVSLPPWPMELPEYPEAARRAPEPVKPKPTPEPAAIVDSPRSAPLPQTTVYATNIPKIDPEPITPPAHAVAVAIEPTNSPVLAKVANPEAPKGKIGTQPEPSESVMPPASARSKIESLPVKTILVAGIALLIGVMVIFIALLRWTRRATGESLITRTMTKR